MKQSRGEVDKHIFDWNMKVCNAQRYFTQSRLLDTAQTGTYGQVQTWLHWKYKPSQFTQSLAPELT